MTTRAFLDYAGLRDLADLSPLAEAVNSGRHILVAETRNGFSEGMDIQRDGRYGAALRRPV
ncbi:MAG: hypothetical protein ACR2IK_12325 [Chloroflexota bacterium]